MSKFILFALIIYFLWHSIIKPWAEGKTKSNKPTPQVENLVKDPICSTYYPQSKMIHYQYNGKDYYFCSKRCLESFKKRLNEFS